MAIAYRIRGHHFPTKKAAKEFVKSFLHRQKPGRRLDPDDEKWVREDVLMMHPRWELKSGGRTQVGVQKVGGSNGFIIMENESFHDSISYHKCFDTFTNSRSARGAFRQAVHPDMFAFKQRAFKHAGSVPCAICGVPCANGPETDIDHVEPLYRDILAGFCQLRGINLDTVGVEPDPEHGACLVDKDMREEWRAYHIERANLRVACKPCNRARELGG